MNLTFEMFLKFLGICVAVLMTVGVTYIVLATIICGYKEAKEYLWKESPQEKRFREELAQKISQLNEICERLEKKLETPVSVSVKLLKK